MSEPTKCLRKHSGGQQQQGYGGVTTAGHRQGWGGVGARWASYAPITNLALAWGGGYSARPPGGPWDLQRPCLEGPSTSASLSPGTPAPAPQRRLRPPGSPSRRPQAPQICALPEAPHWSRGSGRSPGAFRVSARARGPPPVSAARIHTAPSVSGLRGGRGAAAGGRGCSGGGAPGMVRSPRRARRSRAGSRGSPPAALRPSGGWSERSPTRPLRVPPSPARPSPAPPAALPLPSSGAPSPPSRASATSARPGRAGESGVAARGSPGARPCDRLVDVGAEDENRPGLGQAAGSWVLRPRGGRAGSGCRRATRLVPRAGQGRGPLAPSPPLLFCFNSRN